MNRTIRIRELAPQNRELWQKLFYRHQQHSRRRRLEAPRALRDGQSMAKVCRGQGVQRKTLEQWLDSYLHGGFDALLARQKRPRPQTLNPQRLKVLKYILLRKTPKDYGIDSYQWTAAHVQSLLGSKWGLALSSARLHEIFAELGLSRQRAHRDYGPAKPTERAAFVESLKKKPPRPTPAPPS
jgi:transposase